MGGGELGVEGALLCERKVSVLGDDDYEWMPDYGWADCTTQRQW